MTNKEIIQEVNLLSGKKGFNKVIENWNVGTSQFRTLANTVLQAECVEEVCLLIDYKVSKGNGWNLAIGESNQTFGGAVNQSIKKLVSATADERKKLKIISRFFGYLFWKAKSMAGSNLNSSYNKGKQSNHNGMGRR